MTVYSGLTFFEVFWTFFIRMGELLTGKLPFQQLASDELQILVLSTLGATAALVGSFLVLRKMTMLANALSHTILLGIVGVFILSGGSLMAVTTNIYWMLSAALVMGLVTTFLTQFVTTVLKVQEDASIGLVFVTLFAIGVLLVTVLTKNTHIGIEVVMGNVDALRIEDLKLLLLILGINIFLFVLFKKEFFLTTFDPFFARTLGFSTLFFDYLLMVQMSITAVGAFRVVGVLMVLSFITAPVLLARLITYRINRLIAFAIFSSILISFISVALTRHLLTVYGMALSTSGMVVALLFVSYLVVALVRRRYVTQSSV